MSVNPVQPEIADMLMKHQRNNALGDAAWVARHVPQVLGSARDDTLRGQLVGIAESVIWRLHGPDCTDRDSAAMDACEITDALLPRIREHTERTVEQARASERKLQHVEKSANDMLAKQLEQAETAIERVRTLADISDWHVYESRDTGDVYPAQSVEDLMADIRASLDGSETP